MNYQKIYDDICKRGQVRELPKEIYTETHHIVPKCLGGGNEKSNLTKLTAREHFLVHYILAAKIHKNHKGLWNAFRKMLYVKRDYQERYVPSGRFYEQLKIELNNSCKGEGNHFFGKKHSPESKKKISDAKKGRFLGENSARFGMKNSEESKLKVSLANKGKKRTLEYRQKKSEQSKGEGNPFFGKNHSEESKAKIRERRKLQVFTEETRQKMSESNSGEGNGFYGKTHTEESRERIRNNRPNARPCLIDGINYNSISDASRKLEISGRIVGNRLNSIKWPEWNYISKQIDEI